VIEARVEKMLASCRRQQRKEQKKKEEQQMGQTTNGHQFLELKLVLRKSTD
jgi:hypothetical protein